jgi:hypothetical protein
MIRVTRQIKCRIAQALGDHTHPLPEVNFIMVEIPTPNHIYLWSGKINKLNAPRVEAWGHPHPLLEVFFENYTYLWNHFVNFNQVLPKCSLGDPLPKLCSVCLGSKEGPKRGPKMINYFNFKNLLVNQQCQKIDTWHITLINLENRNLVWPNDFDLQLGCCICDAFSICLY